MGVASAVDPKTLPRYPIYVPSRGRYDRCLTAQFLVKDDVPFRLVVEPQEVEEYAKRFGHDRLLVLPWSNLGLTGLIAVRNWIKEHATAEGHARHWQLDDNIRHLMRWWRGKRIRCASGVAFRVVEDFVDRYENVAIAGMNYAMFGRNNSCPPFVRNAHVYSITLVNNAIPHRWRLPYNDDTDICLQVLADGWCTVQVNVFMAQKLGTMTYKGGNTDLYQGDGRLRMARMLERAWPGVVTTRRRFQRPQHHIFDGWKRFDTPLKLKPGLANDATEPNEYGMRLVELQKVQSRELRQLVEGSPLFEPLKNSTITSPRQGGDPFAELVARALSLTTRSEIACYVPTKGRSNCAHTITAFHKYGLRCTLVVEDQEVETYRRAWPSMEIIVLPESGRGISFARNWIKEESRRRGEKWHWQLDDNIHRFLLFPPGAKRHEVDPGLALGAVEEVVTACANVQIAGLRHHAFAFASKTPVSANQQVYSCVLVDNETVFRWRDNTQEDTDYSLQVLTAGACTLLFNTLAIHKPVTETMKGGNTDVAYAGDGRRRRSEELMRLWPGVFVLSDRKNQGVKPSRIWQTFRQRPVVRDAVAMDKNAQA